MNKDATLRKLQDNKCCKREIYIFKKKLALIRRINREFGKSEANLAIQRRLHAESLLNL